MDTYAYLHGFGSGGGTGAALTVTAPAGVTVTVSKDGKTKTRTADSEGKAVFKGLGGGVWTVTITDGSQTASRRVTITADYKAVMTFFSATINVTYPAGSVCTCSDGVTTLTAPDTSGSAVFTVPNAGTWTVTAVNRKTVSITNNGQIVNVDITKPWLYNHGDECADLTGGWTKYQPSAHNYSEENAIIGEDYLKIAILNGGSGHPGCGGLGTKNKVDLTRYNTLWFNVTEVVSDCYLEVSELLDADQNTNVIRQTVKAAGVANIDISALTGSYYVSIWSFSYKTTGPGCTVNEIYLA